MPEPEAKPANESTTKSPSAAPTRPEMPAASDRAVLDALVSKLGAIQNGIATLTDQQLDYSARMTKMEATVADLTDRVSRQSDRARDPSSHDLEAQAAIAAEKEKREQLEQDVAETKRTVEAIKTSSDAHQTEAMQELKKQTSSIEKIETAAVTFWSTRYGKAVKAIFWASVVAYASNHNIHLF